MKKILVDLYHLPQYNFFKNVILSFQPSEIDIFCVNRGKLLPIIRHELPEYNTVCIGDYKHNKGMFSMIFRIIIPRILRLFREINSNKYRFIITAHYQANFVAKLRGIPNVAFIDDPRRFVFPLLKFSADEVFLPPFELRFKGVKYFNALKEWSYLSPEYLSIDISVLSEYGLESKGYIFIREVSTETSNYLLQDQGAILSISRKFPSSIKVLLSLENKQSAAHYPDSWIILKEPVKHIHSLMYFSQVVISSGDSVAREGAMLGVPSIYAGIRDMPANQIMIKRGILLKLNPDNILDTVFKIMNGEMVFPEQDNFRQMLFEEWDNVTALLLGKLEENKLNSKRKSTK
jgi:predicted glycosyltransferase